MKNRFNINRFFFSLVAIVFMLCGCTKDYILDPVTQKGFEVQLNISNSSVVDTRSSASVGESFITKGYIFAFDPTTGAQKANCILTTSNITNNGAVNPKISAPIKVSKDDVVVFVFNQAITGGEANLGSVTRSNLQDYFTMSGPKVLYSSTVADSGLPMYGEVVWGAGVSSVTMARSVGKLQVQLPTSDGNLSGGLSAANDVTGCFTAARVEYQLHNYADKGNIKSSHQIAAKGTPTSFAAVSKVGDNVTGVNYMYAFPYSTNIVEGSTPVTIVESEQDVRRLALILKHTTVSAGVGYYRIDLCSGDPLTSNLKYLDVVANTHYKVNITKVNSHGYPTVEEALANSASNLEYEIVDDSGDQTISNGQYALTIEDGEFGATIYRTVEPTIVDEILKIRYVTHNNIALPTPPKTTITHTVPTGITVTSNITTLSTTLQGLKLTIMGEGKGDIVTTIKFGNLIFVHKYYVDKQLPLDAHVGGFELDGQVVVEIGGAGSHWRVENISGEKVRVSVKENLTPTSWKLMNSGGGYDVMTDGSDVDAIPCFEPKRLVTKLKLTSGVNTRVVVEQLAPIYIGRWGSPEEGVENGNVGGNASLFTPTMGNPLRKRAVIEAVEENKGRIEWGTTLMSEANWNMANHGLYITNQGGADVNRGALHECWKKNANGVAADRRWYLPAQQQLVGVWTALNVVDYSGVSAFDDNNYWNATEVSGSHSWCTNFHNSYLYTNFKSSGGNVRCVWDL